MIGHSRTIRRLGTRRKQDGFCVGNRLERLALSGDRTYYLGQMIREGT